MRPATRRLTSELFWRQLLEADPAAEDIPDLDHLLRLAQGLGAGEDVVGDLNMVGYAESEVYVGEAIAAVNGE